MSFLRGRACGGCGGPPGVGRATRICRRACSSLGRPLGAVFFGARFGARGTPGNVLLSEIYILACSESRSQQFSNKNHTFCLAPPAPSSLHTCSGVVPCSRVLFRRFHCPAWHLKGLHHPSLTPIGRCRAYGMISIRFPKDFRNFSTRFPQEFGRIP